MKKIKNKIRKIFRFIDIILKSKFYKNKMFIFGTPVHGNIGDHAIIYSAQQLIKDNFSNYKLIEIDSGLVKKGIKYLKKYVSSSDLIYITGGGFIGSLWLNEEEMFRTVVSTFKDNKIIVMPQTIFFSEDEYGKKALEDSKKCYGNCKNLTICCREKYSYEYMTREFPNIKILLVPDIVLYLKVREEYNDKKDALFCIRQDKEKVGYDFEQIKNYLTDKYNFKIDYTDTVMEHDIYPKDRENAFKEKLEQFSKYKIVVTDRLHGMVFAYLTNTPCLVFENKSYKVKGVYEWIKNCNYIKLCSKDTDFNLVIDELMSIENNYNENLREKFNPLINEINICIDNKEGK